MMARKTRPDRQGVERGLQGVLLLGLFAVLWKIIQTPLLYYGFGVFSAFPVFSLEVSFLRGSLVEPGGTLGALAALLAQTYSIGWLGALTLTAVLAAMLAGLLRLLRSIDAAVVRDLAWAPLIVGLTIYSQYDNPLAELLAVTLSVWMVVAYEAWAGGTAPRRVAVFTTLFGVTYWLAGAAAFLWPAALCLTEAILRRRVREAVLLGGLTCAAGLVLGRFVFALDLRSACLVGTPWSPSRLAEFSPLSTWLVGVLYAFVPGLIGVAAASRSRVFHRRAASGEAGGRLAGGWWVGLRGGLICAVAVLCLAPKNPIRVERQLHFLAQHADWDQVLDLAGRLRGQEMFTRSTVFDIDRALAQQGRLADELCAYPQEGVDSLFMSYRDMPGRFQHAEAMELYLDLGYLNAAEKNAYELLDNDGPSPYVLEALVRIHLAKGQDEAAALFFKALGRYPASGPYLQRWQRIIGDPAAIQADPQVQTWRKRALTSDAAVEGIAFEPTLRRLLRDAPGNRLAFEYLMGYYLLKGRRAEIAACLPMLRSMGYTRLPRHVVEALLVRSLETRTAVDSQGWALDPDLLKNARDIGAIVQNSQGDNEAAFKALAGRYGDTYTFYCLFNVCGLNRTNR
jgi:hypothetical protein